MSRDEGLRLRNFLPSFAFRKVRIVDYKLAAVGAPALQSRSAALRTYHMPHRGHRGVATRADDHEHGVKGQVGLTGFHGKAKELKEERAHRGQAFGAGWAMVKGHWWFSF